MTGLRPFALGAVLAVAACSGAGAYGSPSGPVIGTKNVTLQNLAFSPANVRPDGSGHVVWTWNDDTVTHSIIFEDTSITGSGDKTTGTFTRTFTVAGTYRFRCTHHSTAFGEGMHGTVIVGSAAPPDTGGGGYGY